MSGKVIVTFTLQYQSMVDHLVVLNVTSAFYQNDFKFLIDFMLRLPLKELFNRKQASSILSADIPDDPLRLFLIQNLVPRDDGYRWRINL